MISAQSITGPSGLLQSWQPDSARHETREQGDFIELPTVRTFEELRTHSAFIAIQDQFLTDIQELGSLVNPYVGERYNQAIDAFHNKLVAPTDDLVECLLPLYRVTRYQIHRLVGQLRCDLVVSNHPVCDPDGNIGNTGRKGYIARTLHDCLEGINLCPAGVYSRFATGFLSLEALRDDGFGSKLYHVKHSLMCELIDAFIFQQQRDKVTDVPQSMEIHWFNGLYNLYCTELALSVVEDRWACAYLKAHEQDQFLSLARLTVNACAVLRRLAEGWSEQLSSVLDLVGCRHWLSELARSDENTALGIDALNSQLFNVINSLIGAERPLNITELMDCPSDDTFHLKRHREKMLAWITGHFYGTDTKVFSTITGDVDATTHIGTIGQCYFWVFTSDQPLSAGQACCFVSEQHTSLQLTHLVSLDFSTWPEVTSHALLTQAMSQTDSVGEIADFFLNRKVRSQLGRMPLASTQVLAQQLADKLTDDQRRSILCQQVCQHLAQTKVLMVQDVFWFIDTPLLKPVLITLHQEGVDLSLVSERLAPWQLDDFTCEELKAVLPPSCCQRQLREAVRLGMNDCTLRLLLTGYCDALATNVFKPGEEMLLGIFARLGMLTGVQYLLALANTDGAAVPREQLNHRSRDGVTPLISAAREEHWQCVLALLQVPGIDINCKTLKKGWTALMIAAQSGHLPVVKELLERQEIHVNEKNSTGWTALAIACVNDRTDVVQALLAIPGIQVNETDDAGWTAFFAAASFGHLECLKALLEVSEIEPNKKDNNGFTPLSVAAQEGHPNVVRLLLQTPGTLVNEPSNQSVVPLALATQFGHLECARQLLATPGIDINHKNSSGYTPLHIAVVQGHREIFEALLQAVGIDINQPDNNGSTPLHIAAIHGRYSMVKTLLQAPAINVNQTDKHGSTPLHVATIAGNHHIVTMLLHTDGIDINIRDHFGCTARDEAFRRGQVDCLQVLLQERGINCDEVTLLRAATS